MVNHGRLTLPTEVGAEAQSIELIARLGADAIRNSDGTELPENAGDMVDKVYATYFVARGDQDWAESHMDELQQLYLLSDRHTATSASLVIDPRKGFLKDQIKPDTDHDPKVWWEVRNRTTGEVVPVENWTLGADGAVTINGTTPYHEYTVAFLAWKTWDPTQMYNYITNNWEGTDRVKELPYDARHEATWEHMKSALDAWLPAHPEVDVVRFTTFFYHFTLVFNDQAKEKFVDWFGYSASVSAAAIEEFEREHGYRLTPEDFVDAGFYNSPFRVPSKAFRDWQAFQHRFVTDRARQLVEKVHASGKEAMMFLGDNWIGIEPYGPHFGEIGLDAVVGSVGSAATTRMIADIPHVKYTEGRLLPYFFPDVFREGGDPVGEAQKCWVDTRRAILRSPLDRIGYGGYISLALKFPEFIDFTEYVVGDFRAIHDAAEGGEQWSTGITVGVLNSWGSLRTWQTHMVAHALPYKQIVTYLGALEALAGMPVDVKFLSFDDIATSGVPSDIDVLMNVGTAGTAFTGGEVWRDAALQAGLREWVAQGGSLIGVGEPTSEFANGRFFQLADVFGVDRELGFSLSSDKYVDVAAEHFITADMTEQFAPGDGVRDVYPVTPTAEVLNFDGGQVQIAANEYGRGRAVYFNGLEHSAQNTRLLYRAVLWAARRDADAPAWWTSDPRTDVAAWGERAVVVNSTLEMVTTTVTAPDGTTTEVTLEPAQSHWL
ncbi:1,3-beta-galactosyl-N-acetylhexosamine phosphorylase [Timonella senegalensis]|uniref:1,3-beta-galactosyl-N-acetylhexosamine phosphorylase n=1 Tax=Timonella senegalensis TaxID=1465825 RepID=UPI0028ACCB1A|nr:1,3-beta-galactosyl-N-acetylhexosamine phosphorylase [Timonella senegalensis]